MRKIFSIMVTLGLVLGLSMIAAPAAAQDVCEEEVVAIVSVIPACACAEAAYNITWNISASLDQGVGCVCVEFPAGTTIPAEFEDGAILIGESGDLTPCEVFGSEVTVTGTKVCFIPPCHIDDDSEIKVQFTSAAGIENPCTPGKYTLKVNTCRAPDATPLVGKYTIVPEKTTFGFAYDFSPTYPGLAKGFVPPFQACGQNSDFLGAEFTTFSGSDVGLPDGFYDPFALLLLPLVPGCAAPCDTAKVWFEVISIPTGETMHLSLNHTAYNLTICDVTKTVGKYDLGIDFVIDSALALTHNTTTGWAGLLHFSSPGDYQICVYLECPKTTCCPGGGIVGTACQVFKVYQKKEAYKLELCEKWNLFSLPLVPLENGSISIAAALASISNSAGGGYLRSQIISIWNYDAFATNASAAWKVWTANTTDVDTLTTLEDGKAYWMRVAYPLAVTTKGLHPACCGITWWVWGTAKPEPPSYPSQYAVVKGWNMVGFTSTDVMTPAAYLWSWNVTGPKPVVYGYSDGCWNVQNWQLINFDTGDLEPGEGYWVAFPTAGLIYVP